MTTVESIVAGLVNDRAMAEAIRSRASEVDSTVDAAVDAVAAHIAREFLTANLTFAEADTAANNLWIFMEVPPTAMPDLALTIFEAFDQGRVPPRTRRRSHRQLHRASTT